MIANISNMVNKEIRDAWQNRWFLSFTLIFTGLAFGLSLLGFSGLGTFGVAGFGRTSASLINLVIMIVPLMALLLGSISISGERERGTLISLLAQPVTPAEIVIGKFLGAAISLIAAILIGFGLSGLVVAWHSGLAQIRSYFSLIGLTLLLGLTHLSFGFFISVVTSRVATALSISLISWLTIVLISDLGLIGTSLVLRLSPSILLWLVLVNPVQVFKLAAIEILRGNLELLGGAGMYASDVFGNHLLILLLALLVGSILLPLVFSIGLFSNRSVQ